MQHGKVGTWNGGCRCGPCVAAVKAYRRFWRDRRRAEKRAAGECWDCTDPVEPGFIRCIGCMVKHRYAQAVARRKKAAA